MEKNESFTYTYSAAEQAEVESIRNRYIARKESKLETLRRLDKIPHSTAQFWSLTLGILGSLIMGFGMSLVMSELGQQLPIIIQGVDMTLPVGIAIGILGMLIVALAYPVYTTILRRQRKKLAPQILALTDELLK